MVKLGKVPGVGAKFTRYMVNVDKEIRLCASSLLIIRLDGNRAIIPYEKPWTSIVVKHTA